MTQNRDVTTIYTTPGCQGCRMTQLALQREGVPFEVIDLAANPQVLDDLKAQGLTQAPVVVAPDGTRHTGFRPDRIKAIVAQARTSDPRQAGASTRKAQRASAAHQGRKLGMTR